MLLFLGCLLVNLFTNTIYSEWMAGKNDQNFIAFCEFVCRKINQGTLEEWKLKMFLDIAGMRDMDEHTGG